MAHGVCLYEYHLLPIRFTLSDLTIRDGQLQSLISQQPFELESSSRHGWNRGRVYFNVDQSAKLYIHARYQRGAICVHGHLQKLSVESFFRFPSRAMQSLVSVVVSKAN